LKLASPSLDPATLAGNRANRLLFSAKAITISWRIGTNPCSDVDNLSSTLYKAWEIGHDHSASQSRGDNDSDSDEVR
jgi:hypothetical protein